MHKMVIHWFFDVFYVKALYYKFLSSTRVVQEIETSNIPDDDNIYANAVNYTTFFLLDDINDPDKKISTEQYGKSI